MTPSELGYTLGALINEQPTLHLPGLGVFSVVAVEPQFIRNRCAITPPSSKIIFSGTLPDFHAPTRGDRNSPSLKSPDCGSSEPATDATMCASKMNPVAEFYAGEKRIGYADAMQELESLCTSLKEDLQARAFISIPEFGTVRYGLGDDFVFEPSGSLVCNLDNWGLEIIGTSVPVKGAPASKGAADSNSSVNQLSPVQDAHHSASHSHGEGAHHSASHSHSEAGAHHSAGQFHNREMLRNMSRGKIQKGVEPQKPSTGKIVTIAVIAALILFVVSMFIFKETFMPLWEQLLYTPEELQYLKGNSF